jgi:hypothetical protein
MYFVVGGTELEVVLFLGSTSRERRLIDGEVFAMFEEMIGELKEVGEMDGELKKLEKFLKEKENGMNPEVAGEASDEEERSGAEPLQLLVGVDDRERRMTL